MRRTRRRWWTGTVTVAAVLIVLGALASGLFQFAVMTLPGYQDDIANTVSRAVGRPIDIGGISLGWRGLAPRLDLSDITLYDDEGKSAALSAQRLSLGFGLWRLLRGDITPSRLDLSGLRLGIAVDKDGRITIRGLDTGGAPRSREDWLRDLARFQHIRLRDCEVEVENAQLGGDIERFRLLSGEIEHSRRGAEASADLLLPPDIGSGAELSAEIVGDLTRPEAWSGGWRISVSNFAGSPWLRRMLREDAQLHFSDAEVVLSGDLDGGRTDTMRLQLTADAIVAHHGAEQARLAKPVVNAGIRLRPDGWLAEIKRFTVDGAQGAWPAAQATLDYTQLSRDGQRIGYEIESSASFLRLGDLTPWLAMLPAAADPASGIARLRGVSGELRGLVLRLRRSEGAETTYSLRSDLAGFGLAADGDQPGFAGIAGEISATEAGGRLKLKEAPFELTFRRVFTQTAAFEQLAGEISWTRRLEGWQVQAPALRWQFAGSRGEGQMDLFVPADPQTSPQLQLAAQFSAEDLLRLKPYTPVHWGEPLRKWLDRAVNGGRVAQGNLKIEGALRDFPFDGKPGLFALDFDVEDARLAFAPDWPAAEQLAARLKFRGNSLEIAADSGTLLGNRIEQARAGIADFHQPLLVIDGAAKGAAARFYEVLRASPLATRLSGLLDHTTAAGPATVALHLEIPLRDMQHVVYAGSVDLDGVELQYRGLSEPLRGVSGAVAFSNAGIESEKLAATFFDMPITAAIQPHDRGGLLTADFDFRPDAAGEGVSSLLPAMVRAPLAGSSRWQARFDIGAAVPVLQLSSALQGTVIAMPAPLGKPAESTTPIAVAISGAKDFPLHIDVDVPQRLGADLRFAESQGKLELRRGLLRLGPGSAPVAQQEGFFVTGSLADFDPADWAGALAGDAKSGTGPLLRQAELQIAHLRLGRESINDVLLNLRPDESGWTAELTGNGGDGQLRWEGGLAGRVDARFKRLRLIADQQPETPADPAAAAEPLDPTRLPVVDFVCEDFQLAKASLGRVEFASQRVTDGQKIERFRIAGGDMDAQAQGQWRRRAGLSTADFKFKLATRNIGGALEGLGFAQTLAAERSQVGGDLRWTPDARGIRWAQAAGKVTLAFENGALKTVEPGAGRVLGLFNFTALPRRLTLDFRDVVDKGLSFDRITGSFALAQGVATTDDVDIVNPSLKMEMRGRVGLAARDYDQRVTVYPDVSAGVTIGALLLGGPAAGLIALIAQEVLDGPAGKMSQFSYRVTGNWDNPQVQRAGQATAPATGP